MCDDWNDLIEFVVQKFLRNFNVRQDTSVSNECSESPPQSITEDSHQGAMESDHNFEVTENITDVPPPLPSPISVDAADASDVADAADVADVADVADAVDAADTADVTDETDVADVADVADAADPTDFTFPTYETTLLTIESLKSQLLDSGFQNQLCWIQGSLLEMCSARLGIFKGREYQHPIASLSLEMNVACPIVPWTETEASGLKSEQFIYLLHRIGLLPANNCGLFPRIPSEWDCNALYTVALFFGPVDESLVDFDLAHVKQVNLPIPHLPDDLPMG